MAAGQTGGRPHGLGGHQRVLWSRLGELVMPVLVCPQEGPGRGGLRGWGCGRTCPVGMEPAPPSCGMRGQQGQRMESHLPPAVP